MERGRGEGGRGDVIQGDLMGGMIGCACICESYMTGPTACTGTNPLHNEQGLLWHFVAFWIVTFFASWCIFCCFWYRYLPLDLHVQRCQIYAIASLHAQFPETSLNESSKMYMLRIS